jgi:hypothetical protein
MIARVLCIILLLGESVFAKDAPGAPKSASSLEGFLRLYAYFPFPFESDEAYPFLLKGRIGDKNVKLLVDTGCNFTTVDPRSAPDAKTLGQLRTELHDSLLGEITEPSVLLIDNLAFGPARFFHQPARAEKLAADYVAIPFDGILGLDFFFRNFCIIDCAGSQIYFRGAKPTPEQEKGIEESLRRSGYTPVPFRGRARMIVQGEPIDWIVDTGGRYTFLEESERSRLKLKREQRSSTGSYLPQNLEGQMIGLQRIGLGDHRLAVTRLPKLSLGPRTWKDVFVGLVDMKMSDLHDSEPLGPNVHGFLGADLLLIHGALIDFSCRTIWFPPEPKGRH